jgi:hypothetical protein
MALSFNEKMSSPYYPRRARWYGRIFYLGLATRHRLALDRIRLPKEITIGGIILGLLIPGLAVYIRGPRLWGMVALSACALLFLSFFLWMGYPPGNYAFGLLISIHVSGFAYYCNAALQKEDFWHRILLTIAVLLGLGLLLYAPLRIAIQNYGVTPLRANGRVVIVGKFTPAGEIQRGDWVAYTISGYYFSNHRGQGFSNRNSLGLGPVLAAAGDRVEFSTGKFTVNGVSQSSLPHMPDSGTLIVPEKHWFIWPNLAITGNWNVGEANISSVMLQMAGVSENQFVGKPLKRWFWRKQILP